MITLYCLFSLATLVNSQWNFGNLANIGGQFGNQQNDGGGLNGLLGNIFGNRQPSSGNIPGTGNSQLGENINAGVGNLLNNFGINKDLSHNIDKMINGITAQFYAPAVGGPVPPHVQRRIMRYCTKHQQDPKCAGHPEWIIKGEVPKGPVAGGTLDLNEMFPNLIPIHIPPIPSVVVKDFLVGVPEMLKKFIPPKVMGEIGQIERRALESLCTSGNCLQQKSEFLNQRATIAEFEASINRALLPQKSLNQVDTDVETRLTRTFQVKKALIKKAGLEGKVEPANNGVFQYDLLLTEQQANAMITEINENRVGHGAVPESGRLKRAGNSVFLEASPTQKWSVNEPIMYTFDQSVVEMDRGSVRAAISEIQSKSCLTFQEVSTKPNGPHLYYVKIASPSFCGLSYVGKISPANPIYLSFMCGNPMGVAIHETLHALGLQHEHQRLDRDEFITINWQNVDPQNYDFFAASDMTKFTSYGTQYDYGSVMHYTSTIASRNFGQKTMTAKFNPGSNDAQMGQRSGMSQTDSDVLSKMYCQGACNDNNVYCGYWATHNQCQNDWMNQNCRKSCNLCGWSSR